MNRLEDYFYNRQDIRKYKILKWPHYFEIYDRHFSKFVEKSPKVLEIGVFDGGSVEMWNYYFGSGCEIVGIDINPKMENLFKGSDNIEIIIGDQEDRNFWSTIKDRFPYFDIIIDDGGHTMGQQIVTFEEMYPHVSENGVYLTEDLHTSYWSNIFGGGLPEEKKDTFINRSKKLIDSINLAYWQPCCLDRVWEFMGGSGLVPYDGSGDPFDANFRQTTNSLHFYDSVLVIEKEKNKVYAPVMH